MATSVDLPFLQLCPGLSFISRRIQTASYAKVEIPYNREPKWCGMLGGRFVASTFWQSHRTQLRIRPPYRERMLGRPIIAAGDS